MNCSKCKNPIGENATVCGWCGEVLYTKNVVYNTKLEVKTSFNPLNYLFLFCSPVVEINGEKHRSSWGTQTFNLPEGEYNITIYIPYLSWKRCGENSITVNVVAGKTTKISFRAPHTVFSKGSIKVL
ncbi:MAG: hypothetical protein LBT48_08515 [Prevotellaceae bacterium]|jgi:hypothetical protein|nr:hypothetical protein [Prevotellaceae bacterium]